MENGKVKDRNVEKIKTRQAHRRWIIWIRTAVEVCANDQSDTIFQGYLSPETI